MLEPRALNVVAPPKYHIAVIQGSWRILRLVNDSELPALREIRDDGECGMFHVVAALRHALVRMQMTCLCLHHVMALPLTSTSARN